LRMTEQIKSVLLQVLRVPAEPTPPAGAPESINIFRASRNYYLLNLLKWGFAQVMTFLGIAILFMATWSVDLRDATTPLRVIKVIALIIFLLQLPISYLFVRFDYEMRWYIVTDRSLRIRYGLQQIREMTMTFANIQQISIRQGPLQRLLRIADLQVRTAGGGSASHYGEGSGHGAGGHSMHLGYFRGVENANAIRDLMLERLRRWRDTGLGDPDEVQVVKPTIVSKDDSPPMVLAAAKQVLTEARALRKIVATDWTAG
jgi:membrane protein YdbS with pleckstrin-like domain